MLFAAAAGLGIIIIGGPKTFGRATREEWFAKLFVVDGHTHDTVPAYGEQLKQAGMKRLLAAGLDGIVLAFPLNFAAPEDLIARIREDRAFVEQYARENDIPFIFVDAFRPEENQTGKRPLQILSSIEYFDSLFDERLQRIGELKSAGISSVTLIDNDRNAISIKREGKAALNPFGRKIVKKLNDCGLVIDISHLPDELQLDVITSSEKPVLASHSNARKVAPSGRNLSDEVLLELTRRGGMVLFTFDREYLAGVESRRDTPGISLLLKHIAYVARNFGLDHIGIGSDYGGSGRNAPPDIQGVECFFVLARALIEDGYSFDQVRKIMGGNLVRFFSSKQDGAH